MKDREGSLPLVCGYSIVMAVVRRFRGSEVCSNHQIYGTSHGSILLLQKKSPIPISLYLP